MAEFLTEESLYAYSKRSRAVADYINALAALGADRVPSEAGRRFVLHCLGATTAASIFTVEKLDEALESTRDWGLDFLKAEMSAEGHHDIKDIGPVGVEPIGLIRLLLLALNPELYPARLVDARMANGEGLRLTTLARRYNPRLATEGSSPGLPRQEAVVEEVYAGGVQFLRLISLPQGGGFGREIFKIEGEEVEGEEWKRKLEKLANRPMPGKHLQH